MEISPPAAPQAPADINYIRPFNAPAAPEAPADINYIRPFTAPAAPAAPVLEAAAPAPEAAPAKNRICQFEVIDDVALMFRIIHYEEAHGEQYLPPAPHKVGDLCWLMDSKFPLDNYLDCDNRRYTFTKEDSTEFSGMLHHFTYDCTYAGQNKNLGTPRLNVILDEV